MRSVLPLLVFLTILGVSLGHGSAQQNDEGQRSKQTAQLREAADQAERQAKASWRFGVQGTITDHGICLDWDLDKVLAKSLDREPQGDQTPLSRRQGSEAIRSQERNTGKYCGGNLALVGSPPAPVGFGHCDPPVILACQEARRKKDAPARTSPKFIRVENLLGSRRRQRDGNTAAG